jgi:hypothetical protein
MAEEKKSFEDIQAYASEIVAGYAERDALYIEIEDAYLLNEVDMPNKDWIKITMSPDARNKTLGAVRLLTAADPKWTVPRDKNRDDLEESIASDLEKAAAMMWAGAGKTKKTPLHYSAALSGLLYGQVDIAIISMNELVKAETNPIKKKRLQKIARRTPLMWEVLSPKVCYPVYDAFGLAAHVTFREMKVIDVKNRLGTAAEEQTQGRKNTDTVEYYEYWDETWHCIWIGGSDEPLLLSEHKLPVIPVASAIVEGGDLFEDEHKWQPFLYTTVKSKVHARQSLILTLMYSNAFSSGANPAFVYETNNTGKDLVIDFNTPGGVLKIERGESITPMKREVIDQSMKELFQIAQQKAEESTIYSQTLGEPLGGNAPYSMVALLSQSGRLPLVPYQRMVSSALTDAMMLGLDILRSQGTKKFKVGNESIGIDLDLSQVPEDIELQATLDIDMPQDEFQQARIAMEVVKNGLLSIERARERYLNIGQSDDETKQIYKEKYVDFLANLEFQKKAQEAQMQQQQQMQQQMMQGQQGMMPPGMPPQQWQMPPQMMGQQPPMMPPTGPEGMPPDQMMEGMSGVPGGMPMQQPQQPPGMNPEEGLPPELQGGV